MLVIYKQKGETPLQALQRFRIEKPEYTDATLSYAGRLDPMAEGVMLVLVGEENKNRDKYLGLDKTYVTEILFGMATDTADILGKISASLKCKVESKKVEEELQKSVGKFEQKYPNYSSKSFAGSYGDVQEGKISDISHEVEIFSAELLDIHEISAKDLLEQIKKDVVKVAGDFRQEEIIKLFEQNLEKSENIFQIAKIRLTVSSGFYVRQFAEDFGAKFDLPALAFSILREKAGEFEIKDYVI